MAKTSGRRMEKSRRLGYGVGMSSITKTNTKRGRGGVIKCRHTENRFYRRFLTTETRWQFVSLRLNATTFQRKQSAKPSILSWITQNITEIKRLTSGQ